MFLVAPLRRCQSLAKAQNVSNCCSRRPRKTCTNHSFRCFSCSWRTHQRRRISVPGPHVEGNVWANGPSRSRFGNNKAQLGNLVETICRDFLTLGYCRITCPYCTITCRYRTIRQGYFAAEKYSRNTWKKVRKTLKWNGMNRQAINGLPVHNYK